MAEDLRAEFPNTKGFSPQNLWYTRQFYLTYKDHENLQQLVGEIGWSLNLLIMSKVKAIAECEFYLREAAKGGWSRKVLAFQIDSDLYHRQHQIKQNNFSETLPAELAKQADESMKSVYALEMLGLKHPVAEAEIEARMVEMVKRVMLELGQGFTFIGNQYPVRADGTDYFIDLLFFSRPLQSIIAVELKAGSYKPEYAGKMNFYLNLLDDFVRLPHEKPSIGIILCKDHKNFEVEYSLRSINKPVGVADYQLDNPLPKEYAKGLPDTKELQQELQRQLAINEYTSDKH